MFAFGHPSPAPSRTLRSSLLRGAGTVAAAGAAGVAYGIAEAQAFTLRHRHVPVLPRGSAPLRILHLSDLHLTPRQHRKIDWLRTLPDLHPDLVVATGDLLGHVAAPAAVLGALEGLLTLPGVFVNGSNDYFIPRPAKPWQYFAGPSERVLKDPSCTPQGPDDFVAPQLPWRDFTDRLRHAGWIDLNNARATVEVAGLTLDLVGVDDPHLGFDRIPARADGPDAVAATPAARATETTLRVGVMHAPYLRVLDAMSDEGCELLLAGHTHGGQLCLPWYGALVSNCDLDPSQARGVSRHGPRSTWLHVCGGLGTSPFAPVRFACRPEAVLLTLTAAPA